MIKNSVNSIKDAIKLSKSIEKTQSNKLLSAIKYTEHLIKTQYLTFDRASFSSQKEEELFTKYQKRFDAYSTIKKSVNIMSHCFTRYKTKIICEFQDKA